MYDSKGWSILLGYDYVHKRVNEVINMLATKDPFVIAKHFNIGIEIKEMSLRGYYMRIGTLKWVFLSKALDYKSQKIVLAHEVGHALLHDSSGTLFFLNCGDLFMQGCIEYEANLFAAELLLDHTKLKKDISQLSSKELNLIFDANINIKD